MSSTEHAWDAIVVGSGFGGAVTAARLAQGGLRVLILERGDWWPSMPGNWPPLLGRANRRAGASQMLRGIRWSSPRLTRAITIKCNGLYELHQFDKMSCLVSSGVGGGSLVYTDMQVRPPDAYFAGFPPEINAADMRPHFDAVRQMLGAAPVPDQFPGDRAFENALAMSGIGVASYPDLALEFSAPPGISPGAGLGASDQPTDQDSSWMFTRSTLDRNYLPLAIGCGAELRALSEVTAIGPHARGWQVRYRDHRAKRTFIESTTRLVIAAGTFGTLRLLFAGRDKHRTLPRLSRSLGSRFSPNGDMATLLIGGSNHSEIQPKPTVTALLHRNIADHTAITGAFGIPLNQFNFPSLIAPTAGRGTILFGMGSGKLSATVTFDGQELHIREGRDDDAQIYHELENDAVSLARGYGVRHPFVNAPFGARSDRLLTVHPLGGAPIGTTPLDGVVDHTGAVFGHSGLFVVDGSTFPYAPGTPPSMTIAALAERQSSFIASYEPTQHKEQ